MASTLQQAPQLVDRAEEMDAHRRLAQSENLAHLTGRVIAEMAQHEHRALSLGQLVDGCGNVKDGRPGDKIGRAQVSSCVTLVIRIPFFAEDIMQCYYHRSTYV